MKFDFDEVKKKNNEYQQALNKLPKLKVKVYTIAVCFSDGGVNIKESGPAPHVITLNKEYAIELAKFLKETYLDE